MSDMEYLITLLTLGTVVSTYLPVLRWLHRLQQVVVGGEHQCGSLAIGTYLPVGGCLEPTWATLKV